MAQAGQQQLKLVAQQQPYEQLEHCEPTMRRQPYDQQSPPFKKVKLKDIKSEQSWCTTDIDECARVLDNVISDEESRQTLMPDDNDLIGKNLSEAFIREPTGLKTECGESGNKDMKTQQTGNHSNSDTDVTDRLAIISKQSTGGESVKTYDEDKGQFVVDKLWKFEQIWTKVN